MLNQDTKLEVTSNLQNNDRNPLNDHDYCSPKSGWIMGHDLIDSVPTEHLEEEPREKRHRVSKGQDPEFVTQYTSSDFSSSDAESDQDQDYNSEDDPDRLWCLCQKPHDGKFMICCDICKDWFHGHCVGVTKMMGDRFEKQGKEWFCGDCQEKLRAGTPRKAIPRKIVKKEQKKKKPPIPGKRGRGRPRKSETLAREGATRVSQRNLKKTSFSLDPKGVDNGRPRKNLWKPEARSGSLDHFEDSERLKVLIKERKKDFFWKRSLAEEQKAARRNELGLGRHSLTANLSDSLDSLATSTSTPNMNNLPINIKSEQKERSKPNIVLQINTKKDSSTEYNSSSRIVTTIVRSKKNKHTDSTSPVVDDLFTAEPIQISKKVKASINQASGDTTSTLSADINTRKRSNSGSSTKNDQGEQSTPKKKRKDSESSNPNGSSNPGGSKHIVQKIKETLETRSKQIKDLEDTAADIDKLAEDIEAQLNGCFKEGTHKYLNKFRSLIFNLRDSKNQGLVRNVLTGEILPTRLVRMSPEEMASHELAKWRERENKHSIELIKRDAHLASQQVIVKKTHKGEEVISAPLLNEPDDPSAAVSNSEPPITPSKLSAKETRADGSKTTSTPSPPTTSSPSTTITRSPSLKMTGLLEDTLNATITDSVAGPSISQISDITTTAFETTEDDSNLGSDINQEPVSKEQPERSCEPEQLEQPKRFRVSIDTKIDPANLSRLNQPLIRPIQESSSRLDDDESNSHKSEQSPTIREDDKQEDIDDYDPEFAPGLKIIDPGPPEPSYDNCWTGSITMPDIAKFSASAKPVSGAVDFMRDELNQSLMVCGRIAPDQVQSYIKKLKSTTKNQILIMQLFPLTDDDKDNFDTFFDYLYSRNRYGVIQTSPQVLKDFYILPIHEKSSIPDILKPIKGPGIDRKESNCLLGLLVRSKRPTTSGPPSTNTSYTIYTPTPIK